MGKGNKLAYWDERESPHYLTIYRPYPMNASMDIEADRMVFSYWVASCIGRENLLAFFHKPKVRDLHHHLTQCTILAMLRMLYGGLCCQGVKWV